jgi:hypothetical protein
VGYLDAQHVSLTPTELLPPGVNPIAVNKYININTNVQEIIFSSFFGQTYISSWYGFKTSAEAGRGTWHRQ